MDQDIIAINLAAVESHFHNEALNEVEKALEGFTDDIQWGSGNPDGLNVSLRGKKGEVGDYYRRMFASMGDVKFQGLQRFATEDRVVDDSIVTFQVISEGFWNFQGKPLPVGQKVEMRLVHIFEMRDGKIAKETYFDMVGLPGGIAHV